MVMTQTREPPQAAPPRDRKAIDTVIAALAATFGNRLVTSQAVREQHGNTLTWIGNQPPDAVVFPQTDRRRAAGRAAVRGRSACR